MISGGAGRIQRQSWRRIWEGAVWKTGQSLFALRVWGLHVRHLAPIPYTRRDQGDDPVKIDTRQIRYQQPQSLPRRFTPWEVRDLDDVSQIAQLQKQLRKNFCR